MSLVTVMITVALTSTIALAMITLINDMTKGQNYVRFKAQGENLHEEIRAVLGSEQACLNTIGGQPLTAMLGGNVAAALPITAIRDKSNTDKFLPGAVYGDRAVIMTNVAVSRYEEPNPATPDEGELELAITYNSNISSSGPQEFTRTLNVRTYKSGATLTKCIATAKMTDGLWRYNANLQDIYFSTGRVGIGTNSPTDLLTVNGAMATTGTAATSTPSSLRLDYCVNCGSAGGASGRVSVIGPNPATAGEFRIDQYSSDASVSRVPFYINSIGYVGLGTTTPESDLHIYNPLAPVLKIESDTNNSILLFSGAGGLVAGNGAGGIVFHNESVTGPNNPAVPSWGASLAIVQPIINGTSATAGSDLMFATKANGGFITEKMRITGAGNVGIGTSSPVAVLDIVSDRATSFPSNSPVMEIRNTGSTIHHYANLRFYTNTGLSSGIWKNSAVNTAYAGSGSLNFGTGDLEPISLVTNNISRVIVTAAGDVGLGPLSPLAKLDVDGDLRLRSSNSLITLENPSVAANRKVWHQVIGANGQLYFQALTDGGTGGGDVFSLFRRNGATTSEQLDYAAVGNYTNGGYMRLLATRHNPGEYNGIVQTNDLGIIFNRSTGADGDLGFVIAPWSAATSGLRIDRYGDVIIPKTLTVSGSGVTSDGRLKNNVTPLVSSLDKILQLRGVEFDWNEKSPLKGKHDIGVIAQEAEKVFPDLVYEGPNKFKAVDYRGFIAPLIEAVKELFAWVKKLEVRITERLDARDKLIEQQARQIDALEKRLEDLEKRLKTNN